MTSAINEIYERCPSCDIPMSQYQFRIEKELGEGKDIIRIMDDMGVSCGSCKLHFINKPMTTVMDYMRDQVVIILPSEHTRLRGYEVHPDVPLPGFPLA